MIAVLFEVTPAPGEARERYFSIAASLVDELHGVDGFVSIERFESLLTPGKLLSLSFWRDEAAVADWPQQPVCILSIAHRSGRPRLRRHRPQAGATR